MTTTYSVSFKYRLHDDEGADLSPREVRMLIEETLQDLLGTAGSEIEGLIVATEVV